MTIAIIGIDLGKSVCSMTGLDEAGAVVLRRRVSRGKLVELLAPVVSLPGKAYPAWVVFGGCPLAIRLHRT